MGKKSRLKREKRENKKVQEPIKGTLRKLHGKGTADPFTVRIMFQIFEIRNFLLQSDSEKFLFDELYEPVFQNLLETQYVKDKFIKTFEEYKKRSIKGRGPKIESGVIKVDDTVDFDLNIFFKDFFIRGHIALDCLKKLIDRVFGVNIEFLFQKDKKLEDGIKRFKVRHPGELFEYFTDMLIHERDQWFSTFISMRIKIEHHGFKLPEIEYLQDNARLIPVLPKMDAKDMTETLNLIWENLWQFCEDVIVMIFATKLKTVSNLGIQHIPPHLRDPKKPIKYKIAVMPPPELLVKMEFPKKS